MTRFVVWWYRAVMVAGFGFLAALFLSLGLRSGDLALNLWVAVWAALMLLVAVRGARAASIEFHADKIVIRGVLRTKRIPLAGIRQVELGRGTSAALLPWRVPYFVLDDGSSVRADEIRSLRTPSKVDDVVAEARRRHQ